MESTPKNEKRMRAPSEPKQKNQGNPDSPADVAAEEVSKGIENFKRLRKLVEGPEPLWPLPTPDSKQVTSIY